MRGMVGLTRCKSGFYGRLYRRLSGRAKRAPQKQQQVAARLSATSHSSSHASFRLMRARVGDLQQQRVQRERGACAAGGVRGAAGALTAMLPA